MFNISRHGVYKYYRIYLLEMGYQVSTKQRRLKNERKKKWNQMNEISSDIAVDDKVNSNLRNLENTKTWN